jgi:hypothetical protein
MLAFAVPSIAFASHAGSVLVLGADCADGFCTVSDYGSGFIVKIDENRNAAYVLTARHVVRGSDRIYVLYDRMSFPYDYVHDLDQDKIPPTLATALADRGHPVPIGLRSGLPAAGGDSSRTESISLPVESWILWGSDRQYLALPQTEHLDLFHLLPATLVRESDAALDVALLVVHGFPHYESSPVLYLNTPDSIATGSKVMTSGCDCGVAEGIAQADVQGTVASSEPGLLSYESGLVHPGFSGGPVLVDGHVMAMNLTQDLTTSSRIKARLSSTFKGLLDEWIGLPRMEVDLTIDSPEGAKDGVVSTGQRFAVRAAARLDPEGQVLAPVTTVTLDLPDPYQSQNEAVVTLQIGQENGWIVLSPPEVTDRHIMKLLEGDPSKEPDQGILAEVALRTEEGSHLTGVVVESPPSGGGLFLGDAFTVSVMFKQSGLPLTDLNGNVSIEIDSHQLEIRSGANTQSITVGKPISWTLEGKSPTRQARIAFATSIRSTDRNGRPVTVEIPDPLGVRIHKKWKFLLYAALGRLGPPDDIGFELEVGTKFRIGNIAQRGIPLHFVASTGVGIDDTWMKEVQSPDRWDEALIMDWRYMGSLGLTAEFGAPEVCVDVGYMGFNRYIDSVADEPLRERYDIETPDSVFLRAGLILSPVPVFSLYGGARTFFDINETEYLTQLRLQYGN